MANIFAPTNPAVTEREERHMDTVRRIAAEGMVLPENRGVLPMAAEMAELQVWALRVLTLALLRYNAEK